MELPEFSVPRGGISFNNEISEPKNAEHEFEDWQDEVREAAKVLDETLVKYHYWAQQAHRQALGRGLENGGREADTRDAAAYMRHARDAHELRQAISSRLPREGRF